MITPERGAAPRRARARGRRLKPEFKVGGQTRSLKAEVGLAGFRGGLKAAIRKRMKQYSKINDRTGYAY